MKNSPHVTDPLEPNLMGSSVVIVAGKGGVGKTTVTAVLARAAGNAGKRVLVIELDGKPTLRRLLPDDTSNVSVRHISPAAALEEYLVEHGFRRIARRLAATGVIDVIGTAAPGIDDLVVLGKIKQIERSGAFDLVLVDGPAAGHAITFLTSAAGLRDSARGGPVHSQAVDVSELLGDPARCRVVLVTLPENLPVNELIETSYALEDRVGVQLGAVVVNGVDDGPALPDALSSACDVPAAAAAAAEAAAAYRNARRTVQHIEIERLVAAIPLPQVHLPALPVAAMGPDDIAALATTLGRR